MKILAVLFTGCLFASAFPIPIRAGPDEDFRETVIQFGAISHQRENELSLKLGLPVPEAVQEFFKAAATGDAESVSNHFEKLLSGDSPNAALPELRNELWAPVHETLGLYEVWADWDKKAVLLNALAAPILDSMPPGSVFFGGTEEGRFLVTARNARQHPPPVFCLTQNALADNSYLSYLRAVDGNQIWIPAMTDAQSAFQEFVLEVQARLSRGQKLGPDEDVDISGGRVQVRGVKAVMKINGILCRQIHEHNKGQHEFYVEENYVIDWMYPYLEPHGLIMKLNAEPLPELSAASIARDTAFWKQTTESLLQLPGFTNNLSAQNAFARMRCAIAGLYEFRHRDDEAEQAYQQALRIAPHSPNANLGLAKLCARRGQLDRALAIVRNFLPNAKDAALKEAQADLKTFDNQRPLTAEERKVLTGLIQQLGSNRASERSEAQRQIADFGPRSLVVLREQSNNPDPEVKTTINELIQGWEDSDAKSAVDSLP